MLAGALPKLLSSSLVFGVQQLWIGSVPRPRRWFGELETGRRRRRRRGFKRVGGRNRAPGRHCVASPVVTKPCPSVDAALLFRFFSSTEFSGRGPAIYGVGTRRREVGRNNKNSMSPVIPCQSYLKRKVPGSSFFVSFFWWDFRTLRQEDIGSLPQH